GGGLSGGGAFGGGWCGASGAVCPRRSRLATARTRCVSLASGPEEPRSRRFLPRDPRVEEPYRLTPQLALRVAVLGFLALAVFAVLFLRLSPLHLLPSRTYLAPAPA